MIELVTIEQAKDWVNEDRDATSVNAKLLGLIRASSAMVMNYLKLGHDAYLNSDGAMDIDSDGIYVDVPDEVQAATLILIGILYRDPDGTESEKWQPGFLPAPVISMLMPLRDPTLA